MRDLVSFISTTDYSLKGEMDSDELRHKCKAISLKSEEDSTVNFVGRMKPKREKIVTHCLITKIFHACGVSCKGLKVTT